MFHSDSPRMNSGTLPRDAELQLRLADNGGAGEAKENGSGKHFLRQPEERSFCTRSKMLVALDLLCLCIGRRLHFFFLIFFLLLCVLVGLYLYIYY